MEGILIQNLVKTYTMENGNCVQALKDVTFSLNKGECVSLIGGSGSGKSTIARLLLGLEKTTSGEIIIDGTKMSKLSFKQWRKHRKIIQGVFQDASGTLNPRMSVYENMEESLINLTKLNSEERRRAIYRLMDQTRVDRHLLKVPTRMLSGGEQRRVSLLRALAVKPKYLVMDEVISGLDLISCDAVLTTLENYRKSFGCGYLFITHDMKSAYRISDRILAIQNGEICNEATKIDNNGKKEGKKR